MRSQPYFWVMAHGCTTDEKNIIPACVVQKYLPTGMSYQEMIHVLDAKVVSSSKPTTPSRLLPT